MERTKERSSRGAQIRGWLQAPCNRWYAIAVIGIMLSGLPARLGAADNPLGPDRVARGDGLKTDYEYNFIPAPGQALFIAAVKKVLPGADFQTLRSVQAWRRDAARRLVFARGAGFAGDGTSTGSIPS